MFSDKEIKKIKRDYKKYKTYKMCAEKNGISVYMVKKILGVKKKKAFKNDAAADTKKGTFSDDSEGICKEGAAEFESETTDYMERKRRDALSFIGKCLDTMSSEEKLAKAPINQIASAMGVVMDKFTKKDDDDGRLGEILKAVERLE